MNMLITSTFAYIISLAIIRKVDGRYDLTVENITSIVNFSERINEYADIIKMLRPVKRFSDPVKVKLGIKLAKVITFQEDLQIITTSARYEEVWNDPFFVWDPDELNGIKDIEIEAYRIWVPDIRVHNNADLEYQKEESKAKTVHINYNGTIKWVFPNVLSTVCVVQNRDYPFDEQRCTLIFSSWYFPTDKFELEPLFTDDETVYKETYEKNNEWSLVRATISRKDNSYGNPHRNETENVTMQTFSEIHFEIHLVRNYHLVFMYLVYPNILINFLVVGQFMLPCDSGEKVSLSITIYLSMVVFLLVIQETLPNTNQVPNLVGHISFLMATVAFSQLVTVFVLLCHYGGLTNYHSRVPECLRRWVLHRMAYVLRFEKYIFPGGGTIVEDKLLRNLSHVEFKENDDELENTSSNIGPTISQEARNKFGALPTFASKSNVGKLGPSTGYLGANRFQNAVKRLQSVALVDWPGLGSQESNISGPKIQGRTRAGFGPEEVKEDNVAQMLGKLVKLAQEQSDFISDQDKEEVTIWEWQQVAIVIDRFMFYVYLLMTLIFWLVFAIQIPTRVETFK